MFAKMRALTSVFLFSLLIASCGGGSSDSSDSPAFVGSWNMTSQNGKPPSVYNIKSYTMTLTENSIKATMDSSQYDCVWTGSLTYTDTIISVTVSSSGTYCSSGTQAANWSVSSDNNTLTLDWQGSNGANQIYERM